MFCSGLGMENRQTLPRVSGASGTATSGVISRISKMIIVPSPSPSPQHSEAPSVTVWLFVRHHPPTGVQVSKETAARVDKRYDDTHFGFEIYFLDPNNWISGTSIFAKYTIWFWAHWKCFEQEAELGRWLVDWLSHSHRLHAAATAQELAAACCAPRSWQNQMPELAGGKKNKYSTLSAKTFSTVFFPSFLLQKCLAVWIKLLPKRQPR